MSIESREINDIHTLYQNLYEERPLSPNQKKVLAKIEAQKKLDKQVADIKKDDPDFVERNFSGALLNKDDKKDSGVTRTVTKNDDGKGITVTKKDLDSETEDLISNTKTVKNSKFSDKKVDKAEIGNYKSIFDKGDNSNAKGNPIGGKNEGGPKGNTIGSSDEKKSTASGSVKFSGSQLKGLLDSQKGIGKNEKEYGGTGTKTTYKDGKPDKVTKVDGPPASFGGVKASSDAGKKLLNPDQKSDVGSDGLSSKNKKNTTQTVDVRNRRGRVTGTKEVRVQSQQSDGGTPIRNRRGRVVGTTKPTDAEGKSFPSTAEIRAKAKADGGSGLSNIPSKEGNAVINKKPLNPDFGKKPVIQKDTAVKPEISARQKWLDKTKNSPAAKGGLSDDQRWAARQKHVKFQKDNNRGEFATGKSSKEARLARRDARLDKIKMRGRPALQAKAKMQSGTPVNKLFNSYDPSLNEDGSIGKVVGGLVKPKRATGTKEVLTKSVVKPKYDGEVLTRSVIMTKDQAKKLNNKTKTEDYDAYDLVLNYLLETNQVDTIEEANYVMIQMDEATIQGIVNEYA